VDYSDGKLRAFTSGQSSKIAPVYCVGDWDEELKDMSIDVLVEKRPAFKEVMTTQYDESTPIFDLTSFHFLTGACLATEGTGYRAGAAGAANSAISDRDRSLR
jgi:hypothetical protein